MKIQPGGGTSRDSFYPFWATETHIHWADGTITHNADDGSYFRISSSGLPEHNGIVNYSKWTAAQRAEARAKANKAYEEQEAEKARVDADEKRILNSIKHKVSPDEWELIENAVTYKKQW